MHDPCPPHDVDKWSGSRRILAVRLDTIGDILMTTPALRALSAPAREVTLLTSTAGSAIANLLPEVTDTIIYDAPWMKATAGRDSASPDLERIAYLCGQQFDAAVIFTVFSQNPLPAALLCYLAGIPLRAAHCRENPYQLLTAWVPETEPETGVRHEVRRQLDLVAAFGFSTPDERLSISIPASARAPVRARLKELRLTARSEVHQDLQGTAGESFDNNDRWLVIHPGATAASRRYPPEQFAIVADLLAEKHGCRTLFTGSQIENRLVMEIQQQMRAASVNLAGALSLAELAALIETAPLLLSNNTGPVHMAAAVGTPVVDLYALTNPQHTPWQVSHRVLSHDVPCKYCYKSICPQTHHDCLRKITPETVVATILDLVSEVSKGTGQFRKGSGRLEVHRC